MDMDIDLPSDDAMDWKSQTPPEVQLPRSTTSLTLDPVPRVISNSFQAEKNRTAEARAAIRKSLISARQPQQPSPRPRARGPYHMSSNIHRYSNRPPLSLFPTPNLSIQSQAITPTLKSPSKSTQDSFHTSSYITQFQQRATASSLSRPFQYSRVTGSKSFGLSANRFSNSNSIHPGTTSFPLSKIRKATPKPDSDTLFRISAPEEEKITNSHISRSLSDSNHRTGPDNHNHSLRPFQLANRNNDFTVPASHGFFFQTPTPKHTTCSGNSLHNIGPAPTNPPSVLGRRNFEEFAEGEHIVTQLNQDRSTVDLPGTFPVGDTMLESTATQPILDEGSLTMRRIGLTCARSFLGLINVVSIGTHKLRQAAGITTRYASQTRQRLFTITNNLARQNREIIVDTVRATKRNTENFKRRLVEITTRRQPYNRTLVVQAERAVIEPNLSEYANEHNVPESISHDDVQNIVTEVDVPDTVVENNVIAVVVGDVTKVSEAQKNLQPQWHLMQTQRLDNIVENLLLATESKEAEDTTTGEKIDLDQSFSEISSSTQDDITDTNPPSVGVSSLPAALSAEESSSPQPSLDTGPLIVLEGPTAEMSSPLSSTKTMSSPIIQRSPLARISNNSSLRDPSRVSPKKAVTFFQSPTSGAPVDSIRFYEPPSFQETEDSTQESVEEDMEDSVEESTDESADDYGTDDTLGSEAILDGLKDQGINYSLGFDTAETTFNEAEVLKNEDESVSKNGVEEDLKKSIDIPTEEAATTAKEQYTPVGEPNLPKEKELEEELLDDQEHGAGSTAKSPDTSNEPELPHTPAPPHTPNPKNQRNGKGRGKGKRKGVQKSQGNARKLNRSHSNSEDIIQAVSDLHVSDPDSMLDEQDSPSLPVSGRRVSDRVRALQIKAAEAKAKLLEKERVRKEAEVAEAARKAKLEDERRKREGRGVLPRGKKAIPKLSLAWELKVKAAMEKNVRTQLATLSTGTKITRHDFGTVLPQAGVDSSSGWLNDEVVSGYLQSTVDYGLQKMGHQNGQVPKLHAFNSFFYKNLVAKGPKAIQRWATKAKIGGKSLAEVEKIFIPINPGNHWTLMLVCPTEKTIEYFDSLGGPGDTHISHIKLWLQQELGTDFKEEEWNAQTVLGPRQKNFSDCGVFTVTTAKMIMLNLDPLRAYTSDDIPNQRKRIVAELINGGFQGDFVPPN